MNNIGLVIFVFTYLILFGLIPWWFCRLEDRWDKSRTDQSRGHRSNVVYFDEVTFSKHMNPPEESTSTDEEDDTAEFNKHMDELVRQDAMIRCAWGIGTEDDWRIYNEECAKEAAKIEGGKTDV